MGIMDFFSGPGQNKAPQGQQTQVQGQQQQAPQGSQNAPNPNEPTNPLDSYAKLFDNEPNASSDSPPAFNLDPKVLNDVSSSLDFVRDVPQELLQQATQGDMQALLKVVNHVGQQSYKAALHHSTSLTDKFVGARSSFDQKNLDGQIKNSLTNSALQAIPNASHPVVKNQLQLIASQMQRANPDASPQEIAQAAQKYVLDLASALGATSQNNSAPQEEELNWEQYLTASS